MPAASVIIGGGGGPAAGLRREAFLNGSSRPVTNINNVAKATTVLYYNYTYLVVPGFATG